MNESELRTRFENLTLSPTEFPHREHIRLAWHYLREFPLVDVLRIFPENLKRFASAAGVPNLYHETITWAFLILVAERMDGHRDETFDAFASRNDDLLRKEMLEQYYGAETLKSEKARRIFILPPR